MKSLFQLAGRQTEGFLESLFSLMGIGLPVPKHSTVSRRAKNLDVVLPVRKSLELFCVVTNTTKVKVDGEGEWKTRKNKAIIMKIKIMYFLIHAVKAIDK